MKKTIKPTFRSYCYNCMNPCIRCICDCIKPIDTKIHFIFLMHPKEYKKEKTGTGKMTQLQLNNSRILVDVDFTKNTTLNRHINNELVDVYLVYPGNKSLNLEKDAHFQSDSDFLKREIVFILIDATWPCAKKIFKLSKNLHSLPRIEISINKTSDFRIKQQPYPNCLSTIETTYEILKILKKNKVESINLEHFLTPFYNMINFQENCIKNPPKNSYRKSSGSILNKKDRYKSKVARNLIYEEDSENSSPKY